MIAFACSMCRKSYSVKDELAGKKGKCPACGQMMSIPGQAVLTAERQPLPPSLESEPRREKRSQPSRADSGKSETQPPSSSPDATTCGLDQRDAEYDPSLTAFLAPAQSDDELGRLGKYRILKILGHGGMGVVYKAEDSRLKRSVAVKAMLPDLMTSPNAGPRFLREAQAMAAVKHDHIATIYQVDEERGIPFLAMEFLVGQPLDQRLERPETLPLSEILRIGREIAEGLDAAHSNGLIHRDIKPANVWLEAPRNRVKILDFGLARAASQDAGLTQQGAIVGTPSYMSPEQARGETVDARSDLFSLGSLLYRMVTGEQPFKGKDTISTLMAVASYQPPSPFHSNPDVPQEFSDLVMRLLEKDRERRPASAGEVVRMLEVLEKNPTSVVDTPAEKFGENPFTTEFEPAPKPRARSRRTPLMIALGLLALVPLGWWLATVILKVETKDGTLLVEMDDTEVEARIKNGKLILSDGDGKDRYTLSPSVRGKQVEAGRYKIRVEGADGLSLDTSEFILKKGGKVTVRVTAVPRAVVKAIDIDRKAAEYVLSLGGIVGVNGEQRQIKAPADLPKAAFRLTFVRLAGNPQVSDAGLAHFKGCKNLTSLELGGTAVGDAGLAHLGDCERLWWLNVENSKVSDAGLAHLAGCKAIGNLFLGGTEVGDAALAHLRGREKLTCLGLVRTQVGDAGMAHLKGCKGLSVLDLDATKVGDAGMAHLAGLKSLTYLALYGTQVGDAGLARLRGCKGLAYLNLSATKVTNLSPLEGMAIENLVCDFDPARDGKVLRSLPTLKLINGKPVKDFWKGVDAKKP